MTETEEAEEEDGEGAGSEGLMGCDLGEVAEGVLVVVGLSAPGVLVPLPLLPLLLP